jgi:uncharacterized protein YjbI with pentapeptide repeats
MADPEHLKKLKEGVDVWNQWRDNNRNVEPDLTQVDLAEANLNGANLRSANLSAAHLLNTKLTGANFNDADLTGGGPQRRIPVNHEPHRGEPQGRGPF